MKRITLLVLAVLGWVLGWVTIGHAATPGAAPPPAGRPVEVLSTPAPTDEADPDPDEDLRQTRERAAAARQAESEREAQWAAHFPPRAGSRLGLHFLRPTPASFGFVRDAHPAVVKAVDDLGFLADVKSVSPNTLTLGRVSGQDETMRELDPVEAAKAYVTLWLPLYQLNPGVDYWEGWNEYQPRTREDWEWYARFEAERACRMRELGFRAAVGAFSTGRPEFREMLLFLPAIRAGVRCDGVLTLHEYSAPTLQTGFGDGIPNRPAFSDRGVLTFRYRYFYEDIFKALDLPIPLIVSEAGIDGGVLPGDSGLPSGGWRNFTEVWELAGLGADGPGSFVAQLEWYDRQLQRDEYVIGVALFTAGGSGAWESWDMEALYAPLTEYVLSQR